jgi:hypothetical protein
MFYFIVIFILLSQGIGGTTTPTKDKLDLKIIGAGWGRTGTSSLKEALDELGYNTYHMSEVIKNPFVLIPRWSEIYGTPKGDQKRLVLLGDILQGYNAAVDYPACSFFDEQLEMFPNAKVILTLRDFESWYESASKTIFNLDSRNANSPFGLKLFRNLFPPGLYFRLMREGLDMFPQPISDKESVHKAYDEWIGHVRRTVTKPGQLLEIEIGKDSWKPLCEFLGIAPDKCPKTPFPHANDASVLQNMINSQIRIGYAWTLFLIVAGLYLFWRAFYKKPSHLTDNSKGKKKAD